MPNEGSDQSAKKKTTPLTASGAPPTIQLKRPAPMMRPAPPAAAAAAPVKSATVRISDLPGMASPPGPGAKKATANLSGVLQAKPLTEIKKETSRIRLEEAYAASAGAAASPKRATGPIQPFQTADTVMAARPKSEAPRLAEMPTEVRALEDALAKKSTTTRIQLDDAYLASLPGGGKRATGPIARMPAAVPQTIRLKRPTAPSAALPRPEAAPKPATGRIDLTEVPTIVKQAPKAETSRVILEEVVASKTGGEAAKRATGPMPGLATVIPQTIKLKRPAAPAAPAPRPEMPAAKSATGRVDLAEAPTIVKQAAPKTETSRIVLEEVLPSKSAVDTVKKATAPIAAAGPPPSTIKLKRAPTAVAPAPVATASQVETAKKAETAKIDLPSEDVAPIPISQRKTIKIKRTERNVPALKTVVTPRGPISTTAAAVAEEGAAAAPATEEVGWAFSLAAAAAVVVMGCLVYLLAAQAFGPELVLKVPLQVM